MTLDASVIVAAQLKRNPLGCRAQGGASIRFSILTPGLVVLTVACADEQATGPNVPDFDYVAVSTGYEHACALTASGVAFCWGANDAGQLGDGSVTPQHTTPVQVESKQAFSAISAGHRHSCALDPAGRTYCWGDNASGQLGDGSTTRSLVPVEVEGIPAFQSISAGFAHTCGLSEGGVAFCWGAVSRDLEYPAPAPVAEELTFRALDSNRSLICGLTDDWSLYCWGVIYATDYPADWTASPELIAQNLTDYEIDAGAGDVCGRAPTGEVFCWLGYDAIPHIGLMGPHLAASGFKFENLADGSFPMCGIRANGRVYCWTVTIAWRFHDVGDPEPEPFTTPMEVGALAFKQVSRSAVALGAFTCGVVAEQPAETVVYCWGDNIRGQLGDGSTARSDIPVQVKLP